MEAMEAMEAAPVEQLLALPFSFGGKEYKLKDYWDNARGRSNEKRQKFTVFLKKAHRKAVARAGDGPGGALRSLLPLKRARDQPDPSTSGETAGWRNFQLKESVHVKRKRASDYERMEHISSELSKVQWRGWGNPFRELITPENCEAFGVPDYFKIVEKSVSLDVISRRVREHRYASFSHFEADVRLVVSNAKLFNREGEKVHQFATELEARFDALLQEA
eukprot:CAMPEP_0118989826 /NCGR_PEP_ID=MMETSP1173-20130426/48718_1 /TAXON_ID=1034831 /ORGANISM="Rhizochromulina marina cf, Strain CCMP1243" /LENGTH=219 /DNA_ID=CAMNT_0006940835 /DNA_START=1 /DNA_END=660 /DNA_ORIENTATION=+